MKGGDYIITFKKDSYATRIIETISMCGEFPWGSLELIDDNIIMIKRNLLLLKKEKYITIVGTGENKSIRITKKSFPIVEGISEELLNNYLDITDNHHFRGGTYKSNNVGARQSWRRHRMAEVICLLRANNVKILPNEKPQLYLDRKNPNPIKANENIFYTSREIKNADTEQRYKTDFTRILGILISSGGVYCIYNTNKGLIKWSTQGENKAQILVEDIIRDNYEPYINTGSFEATNAIMFGKTMYNAKNILNSVRGPKDNYGFELLSFDNTYRNIFYITTDNNGINQLSFMMKEEWHNNIQKNVFPKESIVKENSSVDCDAIIDNKYILMIFDGNIGRIKRFKDALMIDRPNNFEILCFPWQYEFIKDYIEEKIDIKEIQLDDILHIF